MDQGDVSSFRDVAQKARVQIVSSEQQGYGTMIVGGRRWRRGSVGGGRFGGRKKGGKSDKLKTASGLEQRATATADDDDK